VELITSVNTYTHAHDDTEMVETVPVLRGRLRAISREGEVSVSAAQARTAQFRVSTCLRDV